MIFRSIDEARIFENKLKSYLSVYEIPVPPLGDAFEKLRPDLHKNLSSTYDIFFDLNINYIFISVTLKRILSLYNKHHTTWDILDPQNKSFITQFDFYNLVNTYILKYQAVWEKGMELFILIRNRAAHKEYLNTKKKREFFKKFLQRHPKYTKSHEKFLHDLMLNLENFAKKYRTPEIHKTGSIMNWILTNHTPTKLFHDPDEILTEHPFIKLTSTMMDLAPFMIVLNDSFKMNDNLKKRYDRSV